MPSDPPLFASRPEWADVTPIEQYEGVNPLAPIMYAPGYKDATDYLRAVVASAEKSPRVLELTEAVVRMNPSHYTAWYVSSPSPSPSLSHRALLTPSPSLPFLLLSIATSLSISILLAFTLSLAIAIAIPIPIANRNHSRITNRQYRYETLLSLLPSPPPANDPLLEREFELMDELAIKHLKSYQVWHHRRLLILLSVSRAGKDKDGKDNEGAKGTKPTTQDVERVKRELAFISRSFEEDAKNYHTWSYRQWVLSHFFGSTLSSGDAEDQEEDVWQTELEWTETMLAKDIRNNSAWHHRFFVVFQRPGFRGVGGVGEGDVKREVGYTKQSIALAPNNASAWNYLRGVLDRFSVPYASLKGFVEPYTHDHKDQASPEDQEEEDEEKYKSTPTPTLQQVSGLKLESSVTLLALLSPIQQDLGFDPLRCPVLRMRSRSKRTCCFYPNFKPHLPLSITVILYPAYTSAYVTKVARFRLTSRSHPYSSSPSFIDILNCEYPTAKSYTTSPASTAPPDSHRHREQFGTDTRRRRLTDLFLHRLGPFCAPTEGSNACFRRSFEVLTTTSPLFPRLFGSSPPSLFLLRLPATSRPLLSFRLHDRLKGYLRRHVLQPVMEDCGSGDVLSQPTGARDVQRDASWWTVAQGMFSPPNQPAGARDVQLLGLGDNRRQPDIKVLTTTSPMFPLISLDRLHRRSFYFTGSCIISASAFDTRHDIYPIGSCCRTKKRTMGLRCIRSAIAILTHRLSLHSLVTTTALSCTLVTVCSLQTKEETNYLWHRAIPGILIFPNPTTQSVFISSFEGHLNILSSTFGNYFSTDRWRRIVA
ncbi:hypothetical protein NMY22_g17270 [Coprinellus aureogranulatus]|nr:hypothetical protein NMY22_g17270 [Coprinellus aureogranulatus]